jgi:hypothetical protein
MPRIRWQQGAWFEITDNLPQYAEHAPTNLIE